MDNKGLLFIPDISGFTRFVNETEIGHSRLIIQELLELLINCNQIGLEVSEIEGDAILFYKFGESPALEALYRQVETMFCAFHKSLIAYDHTRLCQCRACMSAIDLSLKIITHYGEFTGYNVKQFNKLIGKDIIVAHQLLKNDIEQHEYWLVTKSLLSANTPEPLAQNIKWNSSAKQTEIGEIPFHYTALTALREGLIPDPLPPLELSQKVKMITVSREYEKDIISVFHASGDFNYRSRWQEGVIQVEEINHFLPRVGMKCRCVMENGQDIIYTSSYTYSDEKIVFGETDENRKSARQFILEKISDNRTRLTLEFYLPANPIQQLLFRLGKKKKMEASFQRSLLNLDQVVKEINLPGTTNDPC